MSICLGGIEELDVDAVGDDVDRAGDPHLLADLVGEKLRAGREGSGRIDALSFGPRAPLDVRRLHVVVRHDQRGGRVELDDGVLLAAPVDQATIGPALRHLQDVELVFPQQCLEPLVHAQGVLEAVLGPPELSFFEPPKDAHPAAARAKPVDLHPVVFGAPQFAGLGGSGEDVHFMAELRVAACLVPRVGSDSAEAGLGRVLEGEESDLHLGAVPGGGRRRRGALEGTGNRICLSIAPRWVHLRPFAELFAPLGRVMMPR